MIKKANLEKAIEIYKYMENDFPESEIPDFDKYLKLTQNNIHSVYIYEEDNQEVAYFITMEKNNSGKVLISHLAVIKEYSGNGVIKRFIKAIEEFLSDKKILIVEVESEKNAKNEKELEVINKRLNYYFNAGFEKCNDIKYFLYGVDYYILVYNVQDKKISSNEIVSAIEDIYDGLFPKKNLIINLFNSQY